MILQALNEYYLRKSEEGPEAIAPEGFEFKEIHFAIVLGLAGEFTGIDDLRETDGKKRPGRRTLVPQSVKRTRAIHANLLWDNPGYVLGWTDEPAKQSWVDEQHQAFREKVRECQQLAGANDEAITAVVHFLDNDPLTAVQTHPLYSEIVSASCNISFRIGGENRLVCQHESVVAFVNGGGTVQEGRPGFCMVSGGEDTIERLHPSIKGVAGTQMSGAGIVSFNLPAFASFGKDQGDNAPIGRKAAFAYTTALNHLLRKGSRQRLVMGETTVVFWAERQSRIEDIFGTVFVDDPDQGTAAVRELLSAPQAGALPGNLDLTRFYVLGLAPNASRIAIRFWHVGTVGNAIASIRTHFDDLALVHGPKESGWLPLARLLKSTAVLREAKNIPSRLAGETMRAVISGTPYPLTLLGAAISRTRAERDLPYPRAALIKACINRWNRYHRPDEKELTMALDKENRSIGYLLGRLFAVLERIQERSSPGINTTIRDQFYGAASTTPVTVFPRLLKLKNHHLAKLENRGEAVNHEKRVGEIIDRIQEIPRLLDMQEQGRFAIGYYHQRQTFFVKEQPTDH